MSEVNDDEVWIGDWVALLPVTLSTAEKHCLETIEQLASPLGASFAELSAVFKAEANAVEIDLADTRRCRRVFRDRRDLPVTNADGDPWAWRRARAVDERRIDEVDVLGRDRERRDRQKQRNDDSNHA